MFCWSVSCLILFLYLFFPHNHQLILTKGLYSHQCGDWPVEGAVNCQGWADEAQLQLIPNQRGYCVCVRVCVRARVCACWAGEHYLPVPVTCVCPFVS